MRGQGTGLFFLCIIFIPQVSCNFADVLWGQCHAFCLTSYHSRLKQDLSLDVNERPDVKDCSRHEQCKWCLFACERPKKDYGDKEDCLNDCQRAKGRNSRTNTTACTESCDFIASTSDSKHGLCPRPIFLSQLRRSCIHECEDDLQCAGMEKCCNTSCGKICHVPIVGENVLPPKPGDLYFNKRKDGGLIIKWDEKRKDKSPSLVVYVLRWWCSYTRGVQYSISTKKRFRLSGYPDGVHPAVRCHYMVAAINKHGSLGFNHPTEFIKGFLKPSEPEALERTRQKLKNGRAEVTMQWLPPKFTDGLKVARYLIYWSDGLPRAGTSYLRLHMHKKSLNAARTSWTIPDLEPGVMYFVQVRALVKWKGKSIRGNPASTYIDSFSAPVPARHEEHDNLPEVFSSRSYVFDIKVTDPLFIHSQLTAKASWSLFSDNPVDKYILYWTLDVCEGEAKHRKTADRSIQEATTHKLEFRLFNLELDCVYFVTIHTVDMFGKVDEGQRKYFRTPVCQGSPRDDGNNSIVCEHEDTPPPTPETLQVTYHRADCLCPATVSWTHSDPVPGLALSLVQTYSVVWGPSRPPLGGKVTSLSVVYNAAPHSEMVKGSEDRMCLTHLQPLTHYTVQVLSQNDKLRSKPAVRHFTTPADLNKLCDSSSQESEDLDGDLMRQEFSKLMSGLELERDLEEEILEQEEEEEQDINDEIMDYEEEDINHIIRQGDDNYEETDFSSYEKENRIDVYLQEAHYQATRAYQDRNIATTSFGFHFSVIFVLLMLVKVLPDFVT